MTGDEIGAVLRAAGEDRAPLEAELKRLRKLVRRLGDTIIGVVDELDDEGDRIYLGSTNNADALRTARDLYFGWRLDQTTSTAD